MKTRWRRIALHGGLGVGSILATLLLLEFALRLFPSLLPAGHYGFGRFDPDLQMNVIGGPVLYNKARRHLRVPNEDGFLDIEHERQKPPEVTRIGFFGDSYVEAVQVPMEEVFFRLLPDILAGRRVEPFGFGIGNWGTLHSFINYEVQAPLYALDVICYLFVENDVGDNSFLLHAERGIDGAFKPYARATDSVPGFELVWHRRPEDRPFWYRMAKVMQRRSRLAQLVNSRLSLLRQVGLTGPDRERAREMTEVASEGAPLDNALPSTWPEVYADEAKELSRRILGHWASAAKAEGRYFFVFYVPRNELMVTGERDPAETWRPWLGQTCEELGIPLVDPSSAMARRLAGGEPIYDDHWTAAGHEVVAEVLRQHLEEWLSSLQAP